MASTEEAGNSARGRPKGIQAVETGYRILVAVQQGPEPVALKEVARRAGVSASQAHHYLASFLRTGMAVSDGKGGYGLGPSLAALGMTAMRSLDKYEVVREAALRLGEQTGLGVTISIWTEMGPVIVFHKSGSPWGMFELRNGATSTLHSGAGNLFIGFLEYDEVQSVALQEMANEGEVGDPAKRRLKTLRDSVRKEGFATQVLVEMPGYTAISAPVWDTHDEIRYALTVVGPRDRIDAAPREWLIDQLLDSSTTLSRQFGAPSARWARPPT